MDELTTPKAHKESFAEVRGEGLLRILKVVFSLAYFLTLFGAAYFIDRMEHNMAEDADSTLKALAHGTAIFVMVVDVITFGLYTLAELAMVCRELRRKVWES